MDKRYDVFKGYSSDLNGHEYVDLGLPSGTLWATCNVGANTPEDYGHYLSWDEGKTAAANWGNGWRIPTAGQWEEMKKNTKSTWTTRNGVNGRLFTANNGNSFFLPAAGFRTGSSLCEAGDNGYYWSSLFYMGDPPIAFCLYFGSGDCCVKPYFLYDGRSVRPVCFAPQN